MRTGIINILQENIRPIFIQSYIMEMINVLEVDENKTFKIKKKFT
jgi:hypothetical protein